jgi:hypothetical protein
VLLTPLPMGLPREQFVHALKARHDLALDRDARPDVVRRLLQRIPDVAHVPDPRPGPQTRHDRVYPAYYPLLCRRPRVAADYDAGTEEGRCAVRQLREAVTTLMEDHPRGLRRPQLARRLREEYGHWIPDPALTKALVGAMGDIATWKASAE